MQNARNQPPGSQGYPNYNQTYPHVDGQGGGEYYAPPPYPPPHVQPGYGVPQRQGADREGMEPEAQRAPGFQTSQEGNQINAEGAIQNVMVPYFQEIGGAEHGGYPGSATGRLEIAHGGSNPQVIYSVGEPLLAPLLPIMPSCVPPLTSSVWPRITLEGQAWDNTPGPPDQAGA
ncbi:hypothetical protein K488DRAFT_91473 [Vararia minispora EC-137]|uniref:Uncharacterized protein n=1 Tax=Vararia minispora EC-137 TaxID=1314806 RepID=A0ACB8Q5J1_9AGAM|nr:hypothetical protein K488DRAFT_91473 [Vararia minispora EC-137]